MHSIGISPYRAVHAGARYRTRRYQVQLQREISGRHLRSRSRLRHQEGIAAGNREVPEAPEAAKAVRAAQPVPVQTAQRPQSVQLCQHGGAPESGQVLRGFQIQDIETHVRQLPDGDECIRYAGLPVRPLSGIFRYRNRNPDADMGPGRTAHLRRIIGRIP